MSENKVPFDDLLDVAFAEIYYEACNMERDGRIEPENSTEEFTRECKQIASDYVEIYNAACKISEPCFYDDMYPYAEKRLVEMYPPAKDFTILIDANMTLEFKARAHNRDEAEKIARACMQHASFENQFRKEARVYDMQIGDVIERDVKK